MVQDFSRRVTIVVRKELPTWQVLNTVGHIAAYFGNKMGIQFSTGAFFNTKDGQSYPRNSQYPIIVLSADSKALTVLATRVRTDKAVEHMFFIREMIETTDDAEIIQQLAAKESGAVEHLGVGIFGDNEHVKSLTKGLRLWGS